MWLYGVFYLPMAFFVGCCFGAFLFMFIKRNKQRGSKRKNREELRLLKGDTQ